MSFQFQCPHCNNILQGDPSQAGQQCQCPICSNLFIVPAPVAPAAPAVSTAPQVDAEPPASPQPPTTFPGIQATGAPPAAPADVPAAPPTREPELLHIPCPECKEVLETPVEMLDQDVMCPHCQAQFRLRRRDSQEYKRKRKQQQELKERKASRAWFNWAIVAVVLVVMFLLFLIFSSGGGD
jgi:DNA-directed RNA polymerase subunit M/transcription elongation factor TFIIS